MRPPLRLRIAAAAVLVAAVVLLGIGFWATRYVRELSLRRIDQALADRAHPHLARPWERRNWETLESAPDFVLGGGQLGRYVVRVREVGGERVFQSARWPNVTLPPPPTPPVQVDPPPEPAPPPAEPPRGRYLISRPLASTRAVAGRPWRFVQLSSPRYHLAIGLPLDELTAEMAEVRRAFGIMLPLALLLIGAGTWLLAGRALRPLAELTAAIEQINAARLDVRLSEATTEAELRGLVAQLNGMLDRLQQSFAQVVRFSADAAHELKTPLAILQGRLEAAVQATEAGSETQQALAEMLDELQRLKSIVRRLLLLSMADAGELRPVLLPVDLAALVAASADDAGMLDPELEVTVDAPAETTVAGDPELLRQVLGNLTSNAVKYNQPDGAIWYELRAGESRAELIVANRGEPIGEAERERVFDRFYRTDRARRGEAAGLGLSLAREIARAHRGELALLPDRDGWTRFRLTLPLAPDSASEGTSPGG